MPTNQPIPGTIANISRKLTIGAIIELFTLDASGIPSAYTGEPGPVFAFHNCNGQGTEPIYFQGTAYQPFPFKTTGFDVSSQGKMPRPTITVANIGGVFSSILQEFDQLNGSILTRIRTLFQFLDYLPGSSPLTPMDTSDPTQFMPMDQFAIDRKSAETKQALAFEMSAQFDVQGVMLPRRQLTANACTNIYRSGDGCDWTGPATTDQYGNLFTAANGGSKWNSATVYVAGSAVYIEQTNARVYYVAKNGAAANLYPPFNAGIWTADVCQKTLTACRCRYGQAAVLPFMAFPAIAQAPLTS
jgi:lambda family phage minor tail protein L